MWCWRAGEQRRRRAGGGAAPEGLGGGGYGRAAEGAREDDANLRALVEREVPIADTRGRRRLKLDEALGGAELVIDALLGTGRARPIEATLAEVLDTLRRRARGGCRRGCSRWTCRQGSMRTRARSIRMRWRRTRRWRSGGARWGCTRCRGRSTRGGWRSWTSGFAAEFGAGIQTELMTGAWARSALPARPVDAHKGTFGSAMVVAGSPQYVGAAASRARGRCAWGRGS